jgi:ribosome-associated protein
MKEFELNGSESIELNKLLKLFRLVGSGGEANQWIDSGEVMVNDQVETRRRKKLRPNDVVLFKGNSVRIK